jgi:hypothetical protein
VNPIATSEVGSDPADPDENWCATPLGVTPQQDSSSSTTPDIPPHWLVLAVYPEGRLVGQAIELLAGIRPPFDVLLLSSADAGLDPPPPDPAERRVTVRNIDLAEPSSIQRALSRTDRLSEIWTGLICAPGGELDAGGACGNEMIARIQQHLDLAATVLIVRATDAVRQLQASRILLSSKYESLLTHEVAHIGPHAPPMRPADGAGCCGNCSATARETPDPLRE